ncbi:hypothetical protein BCR43DRAFT_482332 [Syncephalastrum racemosum]|uniref:Uncharacterized protein n=1 Tax=Syncephalastrum racemosum TaxID=13706 RepID=A0A1X2HTF6_SYNRA|nr:hypothetical protein BCR43DRAFT_482332 [Syncephalastrum racemosum]
MAGVMTIEGVSAPQAYVQETKEKKTKENKHLTFSLSFFLCYLFFASAHTTRIFICTGMKPSRACSQCVTWTISRKLSLTLKPGTRW